MVRSHKGHLATIRAMGMVAYFEDGEYRVTFHASDMSAANKRENVAYYTTDGQDAVTTATAMRAAFDQGLV